jgi:RNA polymerase sigma factor (sigma-70 family)
MSKGVVRVVDDNSGVRESLRWLLNADDLDVETYGSADEFLARWNPEVPGCLLLDLRLPGMGGLELQQRLEDSGYQVPIIFISGDSDIPSAVAAMRRGATEFLTKPFADQELLSWVNRAVELDQQRRAQAQDIAGIRRRLQTLTGREREVLELVVGGMMNREIAERLHISPKTVEMHRARVMEKMEVHSLAALVRIYLRVTS